MTVDASGVVSMFTHVACDDDASTNVLFPLLIKEVRLKEAVEEGSQAGFRQGIWCRS